jgi:hypothetical protein
MAHYHEDAMLRQIPSIFVLFVMSLFLALEWSTVEAGSIGTNQEEFRFSDQERQSRQ